MRVLVVVLLVATVAGAGASIGWVARRPLVTRAVGLALAAGWAVVASASSTPRFADVAIGRFAVDELAFRPALSAAAAGMALLLAVRPPRSAVASAAGIVSVGGFTLAAAGGLAPERFDTDWPLVAAAGLVALGAVVVAVAEGVRGVEVVAVGAAGVAVVAGRFIDDAEVGAGVSLAGVVVVLGVALATNRTGVLVAPAVLFVALRVMEHLDTADVAATWSRVGAGVAAAGVAGAVVAGRVRNAPALPGSFTGPRLATAALIAALILITQAGTDLRAAGVLLAAGAVLAVASEHRAGVVALVPGTAAAAIAYRVADHPSDAAGAAAIVVLGLVASIGIDRWRSTTAERPFAMSFALPVAVAFAAIPAWGWTGAEVGPHYGDAVLVGVAVGLPVAIIALGGRIWSQVPAVRPGASAGADAGSGSTSLRRRRVLVTARTADGTTNPHDAQEAEIEDGR